MVYKVVEGELMDEIQAGADEVMLHEGLLGSRVAELHEAGDELHSFEAGHSQWGN